MLQILRATDNGWNLGKQNLLCVADPAPRKSFAKRSAYILNFSFFFMQ
jgi:hypothetical protein